MLRRRNACAVAAVICLSGVAAPIVSTPAEAAPCVAVTGTPPAPAGDSGSGFAGVVTLSPCNAWAVGSYLVSGSPTDALVEHWNGSSWVQRPAPGPGPGYSTLAAVTAVSASNLWAAGTFRDADNIEKPLIEHFAAGAWSVATTPQFDKGGYLDAIDAARSDSVWAAGHTYQALVGRALVLKWNGSQWKRQTVPQPAATVSRQPNDVAALAPHDVWVVGYDSPSAGDRPLALHWDGTAWSKLPVPFPGTGAELWGVSGVAADDVWAVGYYLDSVDVTHSLVVHWNGSRWRRVSAPDPGGAAGYADLSSVAAVGPSSVWAVGDVTANGTTAGLAMRWNGTGWSRVPVASPSGANLAYLEDVSGSDPNDLWFVGEAEVSGQYDALARHCC